MATARQMLIETFNKDFFELHKYFVDKFFPVHDEDTVSDKYFRGYSLEYLQDLFCIYHKFDNRDELFEILERAFIKGSSEKMIQNDREIFFIPVFLYFLRNNPRKREEFYELCMKIHLAKDKKILFSGDGLKHLSVPFDTKIVDIMEMVLLSPTYSADLRTVVGILDYIDYEKVINGDSNGEYYDYLAEAEKNLSAYVSFLASDSLFLEYLKNRGNKDGDYQYSEYTFNKNILNLMGNYVNTETALYNNQFYQFRVIEDRLKNATDLRQRKNNLMVAFTYRSFPDHFYDDFSDVSLNTTDLVNFIKECESRGNTLIPRQMECLLSSFRNKYLEDNNLVSEFNNLNISVRRALIEYRRDRYAFFPEEFIKFYNENYPRDFKCFNFGNSSLLTRSIYEMIINDNNLVGYEDLSGSSLEQYVASKGIKNPSTFSDEENFSLQKKVYDKYYRILEEQYLYPDFTIDYFIRRRISDLDRDNFLDLKKWFDNYIELSWDRSFGVRKRTFEQLEVDIMEDLRKSPFSERYAITREYGKYAVSDGVGDLLRHRYFYRYLHVFERNFINSYGEDFFNKIVDVYSNNGDIYKTITAMGLSVEDFGFVFAAFENDSRFSSIVSKLDEDFIQHREDVKDAAREERKQRGLEILTLFLEDKTSRSIKEFCSSLGIEASTWKINELLDDEDKLKTLYEKKKQTLEERRADPNEISEWLEESLLNGVKRSDGTMRPFTYLDFKLATDVLPTELKRNKSAVVRKFAWAHVDLGKYNEESILKEKFVINVNNCLHEVTLEEKQAALEFINSRGLPHEEKIYNQVVRLSLSGDISLTEEKSENPKMLVKKSENGN